jgi:hypothetical protein
MFAYQGYDLNGNWSLYVLDDASGDSGFIAGGWTLSMEYDVWEPEITDAKMLGDGRMQFIVNGEPKLSRIVEGSTNLVNWVPIITNTVSGPTSIFVEPETVFKYRYYRAREERNPRILRHGD